MLKTLLQCCIVIDMQIKLTVVVVVVVVVELKQDNVYKVQKNEMRVRICHRAK